MLRGNPQQSPSLHNGQNDFPIQPCPSCHKQFELQSGKNPGRVASCNPLNSKSKSPTQPAPPLSTHICAFAQDIRLLWMSDSSTPKSFAEISSIWEETSSFADFFTLVLLARTNIASIFMMVDFLQEAFASETTLSKGEHKALKASSWSYMSRKALASLQA